VTETTHSDIYMESDRNHHNIFHARIATITAEIQTRHVSDRGLECQSFLNLLIEKSVNVLRNRSLIPLNRVILEKLSPPKLSLHFFLPPYVPHASSIFDHPHIVW